MNVPHSRDERYFDRLYRANPDPWQFETSDYERAKYAATLDALAGRHFARALEVGCSIGVLTNRLAGQCDDLLAIDIAARALARARETCRDHAHVTFRRLSVPAEWPEGSFDLIVLSEVLYFLSPDDIVAVAERATGALAPGGIVLLVNWLGPTDQTCGGEQAALLFMAACGDALTRMIETRTDSYRLDMFARNVR